MLEMKSKACCPKQVFLVGRVYRSLAAGLSQQALIGN